MAVGESVTAVQRYDIKKVVMGATVCCFTVNGDKNAETNLVEMCQRCSINLQHRKNTLGTQADQIHLPAVVG